ncbi:MAG: sensor histidine kinase [Spirochaetia bacterium]
MRDKNEEHVLYSVVRPNTYESKVQFGFRRSIRRPLKLLCLFNTAAGFGFGAYNLARGEPIIGISLILLGTFVLVTGLLFSTSDANVASVVIIPALVYQGLGIYLGCVQNKTASATLALFLVIPVYLILAGFFASKIYQFVITAGVSAAAVAIWMHGGGPAILGGIHPSVTSIAVWLAWGVLTGFSLFLFFDLRRYTRLEKEAEELTAQLKERERQYRLLAEVSRDMIYRMKIPEGTYEYVSPASAEILGFTPAEFYAHPLIIRNRIHSEWIGYFQTEWKKLLEGDPSPTYEYPVVHKNGEIRWLFQRNSLIRDEAGRPAALQGIVTDITRRKADELELKQSVEDKDFLIREVYHRVKNNLTMVSALIRLKQREIGDEVSLKDLESRINAICTVHSMLYRDDRIDVIDMNRYVHLLLGECLRGNGELCVELLLAVERVYLDPDTAIPLGLILNEIAANALKHSFLPGEKNTFSMDLTRKDDRCVFDISVSGTPFPEDVDFENTPSLGLKLINALVGQLNGSLNLEKRPVTRYRISIPLQNSGDGYRLDS